MSQKKFNEDTLSEQPAIEQLKRLGYIHIHGDKLDPDLNDECERKSRRDVILLERFKKKLADINPHLTGDSINKAIRKITHIKVESTLEANQIFHKKLISGDSVDQDIGARRQKQTVNFIDFDNVENNEFLAVNQFWVKSRKITDRPDIVIFINGIPICVIECKSPVAKNTGLAESLDQMIRYQEEIPHLFITNEILIGCNLFGAQYGVIDIDTESFSHWKEEGDEKYPNMAEHPSVKEMLELGLIDESDISDNPPMQEILLAGLLKKENLLNILQNFIVFDYSKEAHKVIKKICRYQQFTAVNKIVRRAKEEDDKKGIIWHWQGSGKSLIMVFTAVKLKREQEKLKNPAILIVTDRTKLDRQITETFNNCNFPNPIQAKNKKELYKLLSSGVGYTIITTIQKFRDPLEEPLSDKENIIVLTDEAHRTQYGSFALNLRNALPNASFFAFTGTPLNKKDRNTYKDFSPPGERYLDRYTMLMSTGDGATKPVKYESRMANLQIVGTSLDKLLKELFSDKSPDELKEIKRRYANINTIMRAPRRIERIAMDIVGHFTKKVLPNGFKAQIVASDRKAAVMYKEALDKLIDPSWTEVIITVNNNDPKEWKEKYRRTAKEEDIISGKEVFQDPANPLKILIVCDKLLTGFDAPVEQVMYLDQRIKEHTLLQAVARTNRPYPRKSHGLIVDYAGVGRELAEALAIFDEEDLEGLFSVDDIENELEKLKDHRRKAMDIFRKVNLDDRPEAVLQKCLEILKPEKVRAEFDSLFKDFAKSMDILMPDTRVNPYVRDFKFLGMIREGARNLYRDSRLSLKSCSRRVEELIHAHIRESGIEQILAPINITAPDFEKELQSKGSPKAKASHLEYAIRETIKAKIAEDPQFFESLQEKLEIIIEDDKMRRKDEAELLQDLVKISKQEKRRELIAKEKGLTLNEYAFYGLFEPFKNELFKNDDKKRCELMKEIINTVTGEIVIDWMEKDEVLKKIRRNLKDILRKNNFKPDKLDLFVRELLELSKVKFKNYGSY